MNHSAFSILGLEIRWYGILISISLMLGVCITYLLAKYRGQKQEDVLSFAPFAILFSIIGARLVHVAANWSYYMVHPSLILNFRSGGLAIHGVIMGGFIALIIFVKVKKLDLWLWSDILVPGLILGQAIGRWGNYFNQEAFGRPTTLPWGIFIEAGHRPYAFRNYEYFHPTFFYESMLNLTLFVLLLAMHRYYKNKPGRMPSGLIFSAYLGIYAVYRTVVESLRIDSAYIGSIRIVYLINLVVLIAAIIIAAYLLKRKTKDASLNDRRDDLVLLEKRVR